jgi:hypothetical protein
VHRPELRLHAGRGVLQLLAVGHVGAHPAHGGVGTLEARQRRVQRHLLHVQQHDVRPPPGEALRHGEADAAGASRDDRRLAFPVGDHRAGSLLSGSDFPPPDNLVKLRKSAAEDRAVREADRL